MDQTRPTAPIDQRLSISLCDRWQVCQRLQELDIPCSCLRDGSLQVEINSPIAAAQVWSVVYQLTASRQQLITLLKRCW